jgi:hypothetical protein
MSKGTAIPTGGALKCFPLHIAVDWHSRLPMQSCASHSADFLSWLGKGQGMPRKARVASGSAHTPQVTPPPVLPTPEVVDTPRPPLSGGETGGG